MKASELFGGGGTPVGALMPIVDSISPLYSINGQDWLMSGVLTPITNYAGLDTSNPYLTLNVPTTTYTLGSIINLDSLYSNGIYYHVINAGAYKQTAAITAAASAIGGTTPVNTADAFIFGNRLICLDAAAATTFSSLTGANFVTSAVAAGMTCGASNAAGTLGMIGANTNAAAGSIFTSINGSGWTSQTPSGGVGGQLIRSIWSIQANKFICLDSYNAYGTTDGYTLTNLGAHPVTFTLTGGQLPISYSAASPTATAFVATVNGAQTQHYFIRSTNGTAFTYSLISTMLGLNSRQISTTTPKLSYGNGVWILHAKAASGDPTGYIYKSTDDGATWVKVPMIYNPLSALPASNLISFKYLNGAWVSSFINITVGSHAGVAATHVGITQKSDNVTTGGATIPNYVRIK